MCVPLRNVPLCVILHTTDITICYTWRLYIQHSIMLQGISVCVDLVNSLSEMIDLMHDHELFIMTWGTRNSLEEFVSWQNSRKVTAIMCDR